MIHQRYFILFLLGVELGCGGRVHFVQDQKLILVPPPVASKTIHEKYRFGQVVGTQVIAFLFDPEKIFIRPIKARLSDFMRLFADMSWPFLDYIDDEHYWIQRDIVGSPPEHFSLSNSGFDRDQWYPKSRIFLLESANRLPHQLKSDGSEYKPLNSFETLATLFDSIATSTISQADPIWIHLIYFRNGDLRFKDLEEKSILSSLEKVKKKLGLEGLSRYRTFFHLISQPAPILQDLLVDLNVRSLSLDNYLDSSSDHLESFTQNLVNDVNQSNSRIILRKIPNLTTLQVKINDLSVPRAETEFNSKTNELAFLNSMISRLNKGDEIQVSYEPKAD